VKGTKKISSSQNLFFIITPIKSRKIRWRVHLFTTGKIRKPYKILVGKSEEKRPLV
jgi:hypothetical protein